MVLDVLLAAAFGMHSSGKQLEYLLIAPNLQNGVNSMTVPNDVVVVFSAYFGSA